MYNTVVQRINLFTMSPTPYFHWYKHGLLKQSFKHPHLIAWLNTHDPSLCNSNQDKCEPTAWVIPGPIAFVHKNKAQVFLLDLIDVFNRAENDR